MGNACASDENKDTQGPANQEFKISNEPKGLRQAKPNDAYNNSNENYIESNNPHSEAEKEEPVMNNDSKLSGELYNKNLPPINELPEITNQDVRLTLSKHGDYDFSLHQSNIDNVNQSQQITDLVHEVSKKFENSDFKGKFEFPDVESYKLYLQNDEFVFEAGQWAQGTQIWHDGSIYEGHYRNGVFHGHGRMVHKNGDYYLGDFVNGLAEGQGLFEKITGEKYEGAWENNLPNGQGEHVSENKENYSGNFVKGKRHGEGLLSTDRWYYNGEFKDGKFNGIGKYFWTDNSNRHYEGSWLDDKYHGQGTYVYENGDVYIGEYKHGKKDGFGIMKMNSKGLVFEGQWKDGKKNGPGKIEEKRGKEMNLVVQGEWVDDQFVQSG